MHDVVEADSGAQMRERLEGFLAEQLGADAPRVCELRKAQLGRSRENWLFDAVWDGQEGAPREPLIVRRDPLGGLVETDRAEEFALLRALEASAVPSPSARWLDETGAWLGRPSLVMVREPGESDYYVLNGDRPLETRLALARDLCDLLAQLHGVDWKALGIGEILEDPGEWASRVELERFEAILRRDQLEAYPELELAIQWLRSSAPRSERTVVVHGDFKAGNVLLEGTRVTALLDWELAHLGDPMEDLGWITQPLRRREHIIAGSWEEEQIFERYEQVTGYAIHRDAVAWWAVFATFRTAVMQVSGLRAFLEGRAEESYRPTARVLRTLLDSVGGRRG